MTVTEPAELGLRERKRRATRRAIQVAVIELLADRGLDGVTVEEISRVADVSPRTFFNYFSSKEEAILGDAPELPSAEAIEAFVVGGKNGIDLLDGITELLVGAGEYSTDDLEIARLRRELVKQYPELFAMRMATMRKFEDELAEVIARRLIVDDPSAANDPEAVASRAKLVTLVSFGAMRHAWTCWAANEPWSQLSERLRESFAELRILFASEAA